MGEIGSNVISHFNDRLIAPRSAPGPQRHILPLTFYAQTVHANLIEVWSRGYWSLADIAKNITAGSAAAEIVASPLGAWVEVAGKIVQGSAKVSVQGVFLLSYSVT